MILQKITLSNSEYSEMYVRGGVYKDGSLFIPEGEVASFDTYFNCFSHSLYKKYTSVDEIEFLCQINGKASVQLCTYDGEKEEAVASIEVEDGEGSICVKLDSLSDGSILYPVVTALSDATFVSGEYSYRASAQNEINCAAVICTYKREDSVKRNLEILSNCELSHIKKVFVIDNGQTLEKSELENDFVSILPNKNYGGTGGFTRGMIEAYEGEYSHVLLMDDDIVIFPEALERITAFASYLRPEYKNAHFSTAMLPLSKLYFQHEKGARWNGRKIESFKQGLDVRKRDSLIENLKEDKVEYGAWWGFFMPLSDVDEFGLPLPFFIKFDDVEYGTRCSKNVPIITMNGVCVAHEDFDRKYSAHLDYYSLRNQLIMLACHKKQTRLGCFIRLAKISAKEMFLYRYETMELVLRAYNDFLKGADFLAKTDEEKLNKEIMSMVPSAQQLKDIPEWRDEMRDEYFHKKRSLFSKATQVLSLGGHLFPRFMLKSKVAAFPLPDAKVGSSYLRKTTIQYQLGQDTGYVYKRSVKSFIKYFFKCIAMSFKILFRYGKAKKSYLKSKDYLTSLDFWKSHLEIE